MLAFTRSGVIGFGMVLALTPADAEADQRRKGRSRGAPPASYVMPAASRGDAYYPNCASARAAGAAPIRRGQPGYSRKLDRDGDGVACE